MRQSALELVGSFATGRGWWRCLTRCRAGSRSSAPSSGPAPRRAGVGVEGVGAARLVVDGEGARAEGVRVCLGRGARGDRPPTGLRPQCPQARSDPEVVGLATPAGHVTVTFRRSAAGARSVRLTEDRGVARLEKLPGWVVSNEDSVRREAEPYRDMSPEERLALGAAASRSALAVALSTNDRETVLSYRSPLPTSTERALERLRAEYRAARE